MKVNYSRESDIQKVCEVIKCMNVESTGDYGKGGMCPFCLRSCSPHAENLSKIDHELDCIVLIAKDLSTKYKNEFCFKNTECDCQDFENGLISMYCPIHNENPYNLD